MSLASANIWEFGESVSAERIRQLQSYTSFNQIALLIETATITNFVWEPFEDARLKGCHRAAFLVEVAAHVYDAFFNSPVGYRAEFAASIIRGETANRCLLMRLEDKLLTVASFDAVARECVEKSLHAIDAKIWIYESEVEAQLGHDGPEILYPPWQRASTTEVGLLAPVGTKLEIKGGWVDTSFGERRDPYKSGRSSEIHSTGYS